MHRKLLCWHCNQILSIENISFRASCDNCLQDLHVCLNCKYYSPEKPNSCEIFTADNVNEKDKRNFCEDFKPKEFSKKQPQNLDKAKKLLGDLPAKKSFEDLF